MSKRSPQRSGVRSSPQGYPHRLIRRIRRDGTIIPWVLVKGSENDENDDKIDEENGSGNEREIDEDEWEITVDFEVAGGRLYPSRLEIRPGIFSDGFPIGGITARLLHAIKLGELVDEFNREHEGNLAAEALFFGRKTRPTYKLPPPANRPRRRSRDETFYQDKAVHYLKAAQAHPRRPIAAMTPAYPGYTRHNVRDWVAKAREKGYLSQPGQGFPGGQPTAKLLKALRARGLAAPPTTKRQKSTRRRK